MGNDLCPVAAIFAYLVVRGSNPGALFMDTQQQPLLKDKFVARIRDIIKSAGYPSRQFMGHSFRIGAATATA